jgi:hypothetical protein
MIAEAWYVETGGSKVTLTDRDGVPLHDKRGKPYSQDLNGVDARKIAGRLLKDLHYSKNNRSNFNRPLHYPRIGIA